MGRRKDESQTIMIDNFALLVSHGLVLLAFWRLLGRADLDAEAPPD